MQKLPAIATISLLTIGAIYYANLAVQTPISPLGSPIASPSPIASIAPKPTADPDEVWHIGKASFYSTTGCIGCSDDLRMANGQPLNDNHLTVAFNRSPLGSKVEIVNQKTLKRAVAIVTDRGGFERHGKIIDMTPATRDAIGCGDVCNVRVRVIK